MKKYHGSLLKRSQLDRAGKTTTLNCSTFMDAANTGRVDVLQYCLRAGLDVNLKADDGFTALHCAARLNQAETLKYLLQCGANANVYSDNGNPSLPIHEAVSGRSLKCFELLLHAQSEIKSLDGSFKDIINCITSTGDERFAQCFIDNEHIDIDVGSRTNALALAAAEGGHLSIVQSLIITHPEEVQIATTSHQSPLYLAAKRGHSAIVKSLLGLFEQRKEGNKALSILKTMSLRAAAKRGHVDVVNQLLLPGSASVISLRKAMIVAVENRQLNVVKLLVNHSSLPDRYDNISNALVKAATLDHADLTSYLASLQPFDRVAKSRDFLALQSAIFNRCWASVEAILRSDNGNVNIRTDVQESALHKAASTGNLLVMKLLLQHKDIDVNLRCFYGGEDRTPLHCAIESGHFEATALLLRHPGLNVNIRANGGTILHKTAGKYCPEILQLLLDHPSIDVNAKSSEGYTILHQMLRRDQWDLLEVSLRDSTAKSLLQHRNIDLDEPDPEGRTAIELSEKFGRWPIFELLLDREASNPLRFWFSDPRAVQILLRRGGISESTKMTAKESLQRLLRDEVISVNAKRPDGKALLHHAAEGGDLDLVQLLLNHKDLDPKLKYLSYDFGYDEGYQTPLGIARVWNHTKIVDLLVAHGTMFT